MRTLFKNFSFVFFANLISMIESAVVALIVPKFIDQAGFGYWQLYIFYMFYVSVLQFGWLEGIYLNYAGKYYDEIDKRALRSQFQGIIYFQLLMAIIVFFIGLLISNENYSFVIQLIAFGIFINNVRLFFYYILQDTNQMGKFAFISTIGNIFNILVIVGLILMNVSNYRLLAIGDMVGRLASLLYAMSTCRELLWGRCESINKIFGKARIYIRSGMMLLVSNFSANLILGIARIGIQIEFGIVMFGEVSLAINISNILMNFIFAMSQVIFPVLKRSQLKQTDLYRNLSNIVSFAMIAGLLLYYPIIFVFKLWLPSYVGSISALAILFPICVYQGYFEMITNTFMKTMRMEKKLLFINAISVIICLIVTLVGVAFHSVNSILFGVIIVFAIRSILSEVFMKTKIGSIYYGNIVNEAIVITIFIMINMIFGWLLSMLLVSALVTLDIFINFKIIRRSIQFLRF
ncbi:oligosaccharide flippase family protein [Paucilactobacillus wasatchensis]|uniref:Flippase Wzx n=1 Tax=Paucilactobacillus wasatchensis TaxID=1335616 RepID=A0A0D0YYN8_9LACO|nr:oligosaccharide flippase family protein [Paucilactobacillus wasatchensis]KIS04339.1 flippase Wzx [Paucilactobacillus wasatchensis]